MEVMIVLGVLLAIGVSVAILGRRRSSAVSASGSTGVLTTRGGGPPSTEPVATPSTFILGADRDDDSLLGMVVDVRESLLFGGESGASQSANTPLAWNQAIQAVPTVAEALSRGEVVRILGPQYLVEGLKSGAFKEVVSKGGALGVVKGADGKFVGHLRFGQAGPLAPAAIQGPLLVFQAASLITMQYYLHQMTVRLKDLQRGVDEVKKVLHAHTAGEIRSAAEMCGRLESLVDRGVPFSQDDRRELQSAATEVSRAYHGLVDQLNDLNRRVHQIVQDDGSLQPGADRDAVRGMLDAGADSGARAAALCVEAMVTRVRVARLKALAEADAEPARAQAIRDDLQRQFDQLRRDFEMMHETFDLLNVRQADLDDAWKIGNAAKEIQRFRANTRALRRIVRTPTRRAIPAPPTAQPFVVELMQGPEGVTSRYALIEGEAHEVSE